MGRRGDHQHFGGSDGHWQFRAAHTTEIYISDPDTLFGRVNKHACIHFRPPRSGPNRERTMRSASPSVVGSAVETLSQPPEELAIAEFRLDR